MNFMRIVCSCSILFKTENKRLDALKKATTTILKWSLVDTNSCLYDVVLHMWNCPRDLKFIRFFQIEDLWKRKHMSDNRWFSAYRLFTDCKLAGILFWECEFDFDLHTCTMKLIFFYVNFRRVAYLEFKNNFEWLTTRNDYFKWIDKAKWCKFMPVLREKKMN